VHRELGPGWDEEAYHLALLHALNSQGIKAESKLRGVLKNRELTADEFELDILVEDTIVLELKHLLQPFAPAHYLQLINYLKFWNKELGLLINFGLDRLQYKRVPFTPVTSVINHAGAWDRFREENRILAERITVLFSAIIATYGLGYGAKTYKGLFETECEFRKIPCNSPIVRLQYDNVSIGEKPVDAFNIDSSVLTSITALSERSSASNLTRLFSYMRQTGISTGLLANFGKTVLELRLLSL